MAETAECYYTPERIAYWLEHWSELRELTIRTPASVIPRSVPSAPRGSRRSDPLHYCDIVADIERAWASLPLWSIEWNVVKTIMDGYPLREFESTYKLRHGTAAAAYQRAIEQMARYLGWTD